MIEVLKKVLFDEVACTRLLSQARSKCSVEDSRALLDRIVVSHAEICAILEENIRALGGEAIEPKPKSAEHDIGSQPLNECLLSVEAIQREIIKEINVIVDLPAARRIRDTLLAVRQFHLDNAHWLAAALGQD